MLIESQYNIHFDSIAIIMFVYKEYLINDYLSTYTKDFE